METGRAGDDIGRQLAFLASVTDGLSAETDYLAAMERVAAKTVGALADMCAIELMTEPEPRQLAVAHIDPAQAPMLRRVLQDLDTTGAPGPRRSALQSQSLQALNDMDEDFWDSVTTDEDQRARLRQLAIGAVVSAPLVARGRVLGVLTLGLVRGGRSFGPSDLAVVNDLAGRIALAVDNARLYDAAQDARRGAEQAAAQLARLQVVTSRFSQASTVADVAAIAVGEAAAGVEAQAAALILLADDGASLHVVDSFGFPPDVIDSFGDFRIEDPLPAAEALASGELVVLSSLAERNDRYPSLSAIESPNRSFAAVPFSKAGRPVGVLVLGWTEDRTLSEDDRRFMLAVGDQCGQALERARLADAERLAARRQRFLADASRVLAGSLDYEATLREMARLIVPELADATSVYLETDTGLQLVTAVHADPELEKVLDALAGRVGETTVREELLDVVRTGRSRLVADIPQPRWQDIADDADHLEKLRLLDVRSAAVVPLRSRGRNIGVMTLTVGPSARRFTPADLPMFEDLASRVAVTIENARSHQNSQEIARTLQESLLPPHLLAVPGLEVAARYRPVADGSRVGGDFFDVFPAGSRRWGVVMGDVCGQGVPAASLTAMARWTTRVAARQEAKPSDVLRIVNRTVLEHDTDERFCTIALAFIESAPDGMQVTLSCGGHPAPLLLRSNGELSALGGSGTALGLFPDPELADSEYLLRPGDALVFYTDGFTEARSPDGNFDPDLLPSVLRRCTGLTAEELATEVERTVIDFEGGRARDDMAVLAIRVPPSGAAAPATGLPEPADADVFDERFPATPAAVAVARHQLAPWLYERLSGAETAAWELLLVTSELATNAAKAARESFRVRAWIEGDGAAVLEVVDDGAGFEGRLPNPDDTVPLHAERGRGLYLVQSLVTDCSIVSNEGGTVVRVRKELSETG